MMDETNNGLHDISGGDGNATDGDHGNDGADSRMGRDGKRQQFSNKQRMDMYAFCVLELEMHSNKVSIKKQQQAIQKVLNGDDIEGKTLLQLQQEVAMTRKCYSDYQKTQVLTSSMLRDVQKRFAKYYPDAAIPSRSTIKHVFEKCVAHGTVENIRTPRKATKIPQGDEIEYLLIHEPQLSLRQLAQKLNVSTGTVSRRCKALGLIPESVTIKHQQMATARRQKQIKQLESQAKGTGDTSASEMVTNIVTVGVTAPSNSNGNHIDPSKVIVDESCGVGGNNYVE